MVVWPGMSIVSSTNCFRPLRGILYSEKPNKVKKKSMLIKFHACSTYVGVM